MQVEGENWFYSKEVKEHFLNPKNFVKDKHEIKGFNGYGKTGNIKCGDIMEMWLLVKNGQIKECKWKTFGCASAIASTSILSEMVKGMTLEEAYKVSPKDLAGELGGLPEHKIHCSVLGDKALRAAINDYYTRNGMENKVKKEEAKIICQCMNVTDHEIEDAALEGVRTYLELQEHTKLGTVCGQCRDQAEKLLEEYIKKHFDK